jgi:hypothetical protein
VILLFGAILTPIALRKGLAQLRANPLAYRGRDLAIGVVAVYVATVPLLLLLLASLISSGAILLLIGLAAFVYGQYLLVQRLRKKIIAEIPVQPPTGDFTLWLWPFRRAVPAAPSA